MRFGKHHHRVHSQVARKGNGKVVITAVIIILVVIAAYAILSSGSGTRQIGQNYTFVLQKGSAQNLMLNNGKQFSVYLNYSTPSMANLYLSSIPIFQGQTTTMSIKKGQTANISISRSQYADIEIKLISSNNTGAVLSVVQIPADIKISTGVSGAATTAATTATTTTGSTSTSTTQPTTTVNTGALAISAFNKTSVGTLMSNYAALYSATQSCTPSLYNSTFISTQHSAPSGQNTYYNTSKVTPYEIISSAVEVSPGTYNITYTTVSKTLGSKAALNAQFTYPSNVTVTYAFTGLFSGLTYSQVESNYNSQDSIGNSCAALIP